jgi:hypothetical protein
VREVVGRANSEKSRKNIALLTMSAGERRGGTDGQRLADESETGASQEPTG